MEIYFDNAATTQIHKDFKNEILKTFEFYANPSSLHKLGRETRSEIEILRKKFSKTLNIDERDLIFTSSATEANNLILKGIARKFKKGHIITTKIEHKSILRVCEYLSKNGFEITYLNVDENGIVKIEELEKSIREDTILVSIMAVNNETGVKQPIETIGRILKERKIYFHSDMVQYILKEDIDIQKMNVDAFSASFHKLHGPKGLGIAYIKNGIDFEKLFHGGFQERNKRAGTENVNSIILALKIYLKLYNEMLINNENIKKLNNYLITKLNEFGNKVKINGQNRVDSILNIQLVSKNIEYILPILDLSGIYLSGGSACQSGAISASHVLLAMGLNENEAKSSIRISFSIYNTFYEIDYFIEKLKTILN